MNNVGGPVRDKRSYISRCKFTIAFENESHPGYATEKILEPLLMGSIPIYWGDPEIEEDFNPDCFVSVHRFKNFEGVVEEVIRIDQDESLWEKYVTAPIFRNGTLPEKLTDEAIIAFCERIFEERKSQIGLARKSIQKLQERLRRNTALEQMYEQSRRVTLKCTRSINRIFRER